MYTVSPMWDGQTVLVADGGVTAVDRLQEAGLDPRPAETAAQCRDLITTQVVDAAILGEKFLGSATFDVVRWLRGQAQRRHLAIIVRCESGEVARAALYAAGVDVCVDESAPDGEVTAAVLNQARIRRRFDGLLEENEQLRQLSNTDGLTHVANHRYFQERLHDEFRRAQRYGDPLSLVLIDLDHFKAINDSYGHQVGDVVLRGVAASVRQCVRETDVVARYGGEEFVALLPRTPLSHAVQVADRMKANLELLRFRPDEVRVTASLGVSTHPQSGAANAEELVRAADDALFRAKSDGRNRISIHLASAILPSEIAGAA